jgi:hypothetical protein
MAADLHVVARDLFAAVMAPLVLGGDVRPGHAIGGRSALAMTQAAGVEAAAADLFDRVQAGRVRRARRLAPIDGLPPADGAEWAMSAALHDVLQAANPTFKGAMRRSMARRILEVAIATLDRIPSPRTAAEALSRHSWFARVTALTRTDTSVSWWSGSRVYRGVAPPARLQAWPGIRRVTVIEKAHPLLELAPLAVDRDRLTHAVALLLDRSPLTALATCTRAAPTFAWSGGTLAVAASGAGRALALRALEQLPDLAVDEALGRATRDLLERRRDLAEPALGLLSDRAIAAAAGHVAVESGTVASADAALAQTLGAAVAVRRLESGESGWRASEQRRLLDWLGPVARGAAGDGAGALLEGR